MVESIVNDPDGERKIKESTLCQLIYENLPWRCQLLRDHVLQCGLPQEKLQSMLQTLELVDKTVANQSLT
jgi:hypothetical protein